MPDDFDQLEWDAVLENDCRQLIRLAVREDLGRSQDWTTNALVPHDALGSAAVVVRQPGVVAGMPVVQAVVDEMAPSVKLEVFIDDGSQVEPGVTVAQLSGPARDLLTSERIMLNFLSRLSGVATLTAAYVAACEGTGAAVYDTRKTTPGWRRLEKYAVRQAGGRNHRLGLFDAVLIKDNHLAFAHGEADTSPGEAVRRARQFLAQQESDAMVEIEVDTLEQLQMVLPVGPDVVLLDNMPPETLCQAVAMRNQLGPQVQLEASGGVNLDTIRTIAETGVERISVGALTHSAISLDFGLDWL